MNAIERETITCYAELPTAPLSVIRETITCDTHQVYKHTL